MEWISYDIDGWLGTAASTSPTWSGFIDVNNPAAVAAGNFLESPATNTAAITATIANLRANGSATNVANTAVFFTGSNTNVLNSYGWGGILNTQNGVSAHRIQGGAGVTQLSDATGATFAGTDVYENYKLAWTA